LRILVADDNRDAAETLSILLEVMGHEVRTVHDGQAAVEAADSFDPELVLLDIGMPGLNGYDTCRRIRAQAAGAGRTVVAVTGWGQPHDVQSAHEAGFDRHLVKPVDMDTLMELISSRVAAGRG
jgi:CheY-like chemotaxis protein